MFSAALEILYAFPIFGIVGANSIEPTLEVMIKIFLALLFRISGRNSRTRRSGAVTVKLSSDASCSASLWPLLAGTKSKRYKNYTAWAYSSSNFVNGLGFTPALLMRLSSPFGSSRVIFSTAERMLSCLETSRSRMVSCSLLFWVLSSCRPDELAAFLAVAITVLSLFLS